VRVLPPGNLPNLKNVRGTNYCDIGLAVNPRTNALIIITVIDNLVKGASGQAVQNMNLMLGYPEETAMNAMALFP
jgi:N-acetyl-gamma-glutamyl-phosphate reductase